MISGGRRFVCPRTLNEATALMREAAGRARILGGGSVLVPALSAGLDDPDLVLDPLYLGLDGIRVTGDHVIIGARATYAALEASDVIRSRLPLLAAMVREVTGGPGLWNLATLGGSACYANPASDGPGCLAALQAQFQLVSASGKRLVPARDFFRKEFETARQLDEILTEIVVFAPASPGPSVYLKLKHATSSWPIVTASCIVTGQTPPQVRVRLCLGGVAPSPLTMEWPRREPLDDNRIAAMARQTEQEIGTEWTDELAAPGYRKAVAGKMAMRALRAVEGVRP